MSRELNDAIHKINEDRILRYEAVRYFIARMPDSHLHLITNFCISQERERYQELSAKQSKEGS